MDFKVIPSSDVREWNKILNNIEKYDLYHTPSYNQLDNSGESRLLTFHKNEKYLAIPLIFRNIPGTPWNDVSSVYGYAGWIGSTEMISHEVFDILENYLKKERVISVFSRLHPLLKGSDIFLKGIVEQIGFTTAINLKLEPQLQTSYYSKSVLRFINKKKKEGITIRKSNNIQDINSFISIYYQSMDKHMAPALYYFPDSYFYELFESKDFESFLLVAEYENTLLGGAIFIITKEIMQYHLGAVADNHKYQSPLKLIIDEARIIGNNRKLATLHLGGGVGGHNDNLFIFKSRISTDTYPFKVWKWIINKKIYNELSANKPNSSFFPLYRC